jgi:antirestriction protein ArdC
MRKDHLDVHQVITDQIISAIEAGVDKAKLPWHRTGTSSFLPRNAVTGNDYAGINVLSLWVNSELRGYSRNRYATYRQWQSVGAQVRKGEKAAMVVFYKEYDSDPNPDDPVDDGKRRVAKASYVFNVDQVEGAEEEASVPTLPPVKRIARVEQFIAAQGVPVTIGGETACYRPSTDRIQMPDEHLFFNPDTGARTEDWYSVHLHELVHSTGHSKRLARDLTGRFGTENYAGEELVAELGASFLCAELGISSSLRADHACYIANWLKVLKDDKKAIFFAAARASEAAKYLRAKAEVPHAEAA